MSEDEARQALGVVMRQLDIYEGNGTATLWELRAADALHALLDED